MYSYVEQNKMLSDSQYGFRSGLSTSMAISDIHENLLKNREEKYNTCPIFCDLSKVFDTVDHSILLHKREHFYGIRGIPLKLLTNYLQDRQQYTVVEGYKSDVIGWAWLSDCFSRLSLNLCCLFQALSIEMCCTAEYLQRKHDLTCITSTHARKKDAIVKKQRF